jgi:hypothetical protein
MMHQCREKIDAFRLEVIPAQAGIRQRVSANMSFPRKRESRNALSGRVPNETIG